MTERIHVLLPVHNRREILSDVAVPTLKGKGAPIEDQFQ